MQHELLFLGASRDDHTNFRTNLGVVVEVMPRRINRILSVIVHRELEFVTVFPGPLLPQPGLQRTMLRNEYVAFLRKLGRDGEGQRL
jgi:hypothetical protein